MPAAEETRYASGKDQFADLARYYDSIMAHVDYERWYAISTALSDLLPKPIRHLDACCGTGILIKMLRVANWNSVGADLSFAMLRTAQKQNGTRTLAAADLRALPFHECFDFITCLFDSVNFILAESDMRRAIAELGAALNDGGLLYFDIVTERMVRDHFADQWWTESNGHFSTTWSSTFDRAKGLAETRIQVNTGAESTIRERIYSLKAIQAAISEAGLTLLAAYDADTWARPTRRSTRIDLVAAKRPVHEVHKRFRKLAKEIRLLVRTKPAPRET